MRMTLPTAERDTPTPDATLCETATRDETTRALPAQNAPESDPPDPDASALARHRRWCNVRRVLLIRPDEPERLLLSTPAFAAVRDTLPWAHLTLLASAEVVALRHHLPVVDEIMGFQVPWVASGAAALAEEPAHMRGDAEMHLVRRLRRSHFDAAILFTSPDQSPWPAALVCRMAGIPMTLAYARDPAHGLLTDAVPDGMTFNGAWMPGAGDAAAFEDDSRRQLDLVAHVGLRTTDERLRLRVPPRDRSAARQALLQAGVREGQGHVLGIPSLSVMSCPTALQAMLSALSRMADEIKRQSGSGDLAPVIVLTAPSPAIVDAALAVIHGRARVLVRAPGERRLPDLIALIEGAAGVVGDEAWVLSVAAAFQVRSERLGASVALAVDDATERHEPIEATEAAEAADAPAVADTNDIDPTTPPRRRPRSRRLTTAPASARSIAPARLPTPSDSPAW